MGQLSDPYQQGEDDELSLSISGLPEEPDKPDDDADDTDDVLDDDLEDDDELDDDDDESDELDDEDDESDELDDDDDELAYDLSEWDNDQLDRLFADLEAADIAYNWDGDELFIEVADEQAVDELLEQITHPDTLAVDDEDEDDGGGWLLGELFVAADRLQHDPEEHESIAALLQLANVADEADVPYGLSEAEWESLRERVTTLATALEPEKPDLDAVIEAAQELRSATRRYV